VGLKRLYLRENTNVKRFQKCICETVMKNRFIFYSVAQTVDFKAATIGRILKVQSQINPAVHSFTIMLSSKKFNQAGCR
jgi:hypothetical protein